MENTKHAQNARSSLVHSLLDCLNIMSSFPVLAKIFFVISVTCLLFPQIIFEQISWCSWSSWTRIANWDDGCEIIAHINSDKREKFWNEVDYEKPGILLKNKRQQMLRETEHQLPSSTKSLLWKFMYVAFQKMEFTYKCDMSLKNLEINNIYLYFSFQIQFGQKSMSMLFQMFHMAPRTSGHTSWNGDSGGRLVPDSPIWTKLTFTRFWRRMGRTASSKRVTSWPSCTLKSRDRSARESEWRSRPWVGAWPTCSRYLVWRTKLKLSTS